MVKRMKDKDKYLVIGNSYLTIDDVSLQRASFICTNCGGAFGGTGVVKILESFNYCPFCGMNLEGEKEDETY